jgi:hypothetical protein
MKSILFAILLASSTGAMAQAYGNVLSNQVQMFTVPDNPQHAHNHTMAQEQNLRGDESPYTYAKGELPLSDFAKTSGVLSLGETARNVRKQHAMARRATIVMSNVDR